MFYKWTVIIDEVFLNNVTEKRKHPRKKQKELFVKYRLVRSAFVDAAENISEGGVFIASESPLPLHSEIEVILSDGRTEPLILPGRVVRVVWKSQGEKDAGMAIEFNEEMSADKLQRLKMLLEKHHLEDASV